MQITLIGIVLVPLSLLWAANPVRLLQLALVAAVFEAGASLVIGGNFGLPPAMVPGLFFITYVLLQYSLGMRYPAEAAVLRALIPLFLLLGYAVLSAMILPDFFAGTVMVWPQRPDPLEPGFVPLAFNSGNITQSLYLAMNVGMATAAAVFLTRAAIPYRSILTAYLLGGYVVVALALWQFASRIVGVPFPDDVLYSNPGWAIVEQSIGTVPRIQGPFSEPAGLAFYLSGLCFCCLWLTAYGHRLMQLNLLLALAIFVMLLSTSTTGMLTLLLGLPLILVFATARTDVRALKHLVRAASILALGGLLVLGPVFVMRPDLVISVSSVTDATLSKGESDSFTERTGIDGAALGTVNATFALGVGWGSFRTSSLIPGLLANAGIFGIAMVLWLIVRVVRLTTRAGAAMSGHPGRLVVHGFSAALCGQLTAALLSSPTIGSLAFFLQLGCVIGTAARMLAEPALTAAPAKMMLRGVAPDASEISTSEIHAE